MAVTEAVLAKAGAARDGVQEPCRASALALSIYLSKVRHTDRDPVVISPTVWHSAIMGQQNRSHNGRAAKSVLEDMRSVYRNLIPANGAFATKQLEDLEGRVWYIRPERLFDRRGQPASPVHFLAWLRKQDSWLEV